VATSPSRPSDSGGRAARPRRTAVPVTSADVGDVEGRTFRSSGQTLVSGVMMVLWPVVLLGLALSAAASPVAAVILALLGILGGVAYYRSFRMRLDVDGEGITVVGFTSTRHVPWDEVVGVMASYEGLRVLVPEGRGPILHTISRSRRSVTSGEPCWADAVADRLTEEARLRQADA
jgi:hypothetical protein